MTGTTLNPFRDFVSLRDAIDRLFEESFVSPERLLSWTTIAAGRTLPLEVYETPDDIVVRALVPGMDPEDLDVQVHQGLLTLRAKAKAPEAQDKWTWHVREFGYGEVVRQVALPKGVDVDQVRTTLEKGILTLTLPKLAEARPKQIKVVAQPQIAAGMTSA
jgi:HSP20 family protein